ncbi:hypothetical protein FA95DRAFT_1609083 [Auriscalpium vulgare]|uniref:Uncharacterized protein n=1 Tax=Auriscalpium vulgare TaxID=40419 RepID=A0ACB8RJA8_9AGAM|nr:hypothetical protein FA95DRAFT_1609083 [Auriscalpium vulgare]
MAGVKSTLGPILLGSLLSVMLSTVVAVQTFFYFRVYPNDLLRLKLIVCTVWALDAAHAALMCTATWDYLIVNFGNDAAADHIPLTIALTVALTATITFVVHIFFAHRVLRLSKNNWWLTTPLFALAFGRLGAALVSTVEMGKLKSFRAFTDDYGYVFTFGLSQSCALDIFITAAMGYYLHTSRTGFGGRMDRVIDMIMIYTFNNGALTCVTTVVSLICWLSMPRNLVFLGLHFAISKLYANSLLATLNSRRSLRSRSQPSGDTDLPVLLPNRRMTGLFSEVHTSSRSMGDNLTSKTLQVSVEKTVRCEVHSGDLLEPSSSLPAN